MKNIIKNILLLPITVFLIVWGASLLKCSVLTIMHGKEFETAYTENTMIGGIDYLRILEYSENFAKVYYVSKNRSGGNVLNHSQVSRHKKAQFFRGSGYLVCSQYKASASLGVSILSVPCGLFVL